ncbi:MAG: 30S ribosomal protein S5 [Candidatus Pacebacteria bacterium]|nr:30S ribosomal protein S5 [Candidatus Paceibacterota bacterium]
MAKLSKQPAKEFEEKVIQVSRVSKKTKGGDQMGFSVLTVAGDRKGRVGVGLGKAKDVRSAIRKGIRRAKKRLIKVPMDGTTIPFEMTVKKGAGKVLLKPAAKGSGVIAGGPVRAVVEAAGIRDISAKILGSDNQASSVYATFEALKRISKIVRIKGIKLRSVAEVEAKEKRKLEKLSAKKQRQTAGKKRAGKSATSKKQAKTKTKQAKKKTQATKKSQKTQSTKTSNQSKAKSSASAKTRSTNRSKTTKKATKTKSKKTAKTKSKAKKKTK